MVVIDGIVVSVLLIFIDNYFIILRIKIVLVQAVVNILFFRCNKCFHAGGCTQ